MSNRAPFVLLDDARPGGRAHLYADPVEIVRADTPAEVAPALARLRQARHHAAGFLAYEAGHALEPRLAGVARTPGLPLLWFGLFADRREVDAAAWLPDPAGGWVGAPAPRIARDAYLAAVARAQEAIRAGDIYQANVTFDCGVRLAGDPCAIYAGLRLRQRAGYGALVHTGEDWLLSLSPELFFTLEGGVLTARPMKGTAPADAPDSALTGDPKQRAENLMIVDLLRNDMSRVAAPGSVAVPRLFEVESYPTLRQMTSTVTARLDEGRDAVDALAALYPCGSITGAPKIRAMEIVAEVEARPRGIYTGAIGRLDPAGDAAFNVAIRTLHLKGGRGHLKGGEGVASLGLGSGIVADSRPADEWRECLDKGEFVASTDRFDLIETMAFEPAEGLLRLERHLTRMKASANLFGFAFDRHDARNELQAATFRLRDRARVRLLAARDGAMAVEIRPAPVPPAEPVTVALVALPVDPADFRLRHKTTARGFHDRARADAGTFEVAFVDPEGFLTEGSFTSLFVERGGVLLTPPLSRGLLPGVLRAELIESGAAIEADLVPADLADGFMIGNAVRGLLPARILAL